MIRSVEVLTPIEVYSSDYIGVGDLALLLALKLYDIRDDTALLPVGVYELEEYEDSMGTRWYLMKGTRWGCWDATWESIEERGECKLMYDDEMYYNAIKVHKKTRVWLNPHYNSPDPFHTNNLQIVPDRATSSMAYIEPGTYNFCKANEEVEGEAWLMIEGTQWGAWQSTWEMFRRDDSSNYELIREVPNKSKSEHIPLGAYVMMYHNRTTLEEDMGRGKISKIEYNPEKHAIVEYVYMGEVLLSDYVMEYLNSKPILVGNGGEIRIGTSEDR